jgi:L-methionine (R)-S-oxide reductase
VLDDLTAVFMRECSREERARDAARVLRRTGGFRWVGLYDVTETEIAVIGWDGPGPPAHPRFPVGQGLSGAAVAGGETIVVADVTTDPRYLTTLGGTRSEIVVPVRIDGAVRGLIDVESDELDAFSEEGSALLERCAESLAPLWHGGNHVSPMDPL